MAQPSEPPPPAYSESPHVGHPSQPNVNAGGTRPEPQRYSSEQEEPLPLDEDETASMEDEERPLPPGWVRQYDPNSKHNFFVDTNANPPRSIWVHPYFDEQFQREHRDQIPQEYLGLYEQPEQQQQEQQRSGNLNGGQQQYNNPNPRTQMDPQRKRWFGEKLKDKITGSTHEEREVKRERRRELERQAHQLQLQRQREFMERRRQMAQQMPLGYPGGGGMYAAPRYPYRRGYGGGMGGMGMGMPLMGGLAGGMLLGGAMDGGFGGGDCGGGGGC